MKRLQRKTIMTNLMASACITIALSGCATDEKNTDSQNVDQEISAADIQQTPDLTSDEIMVNETVESTTDESNVSETTDNNPDTSNETTAIPTETLETALNPQSLYEQFLNNDTPITYNSHYSDNIDLESILENGNSYTLTELGQCVSKYYERWDKTSYDYVQYAYVECPDSTDIYDKNLLVKFVGLNIYSRDDNSYAVFVIAKNNGQLYVTDMYECWARSDTTAYGNGTLNSWGSGGAEYHSYTLSVILSNGKQTTIYDKHILSGWCAGDIAGAIYNDVFNENVYPNMTVYISTIGDEKFYQYDTSYCSEEEKPLCEIYISRCHDEAGINWITDEELQNAIRSQCSALGIDFSITEDREEVVWNNLP